MAVEVKLPDLGEGIEDATINRWLVQEGGEINEGDTLLEIATDKVDTEVPAPASGKVLKINYGEGELVPVNAVLAVIGAEGEKVATTPDGGERAGELKQRKVAETPDAAAEEVVAGNGHVKVSPVAKRVAADKGIEIDSIPVPDPAGVLPKKTS